MTTPTPRAARRADALTRERIVTAAVEILDAEGEDALTFRALTTRLATGAGAVYHHVAGKDELLAAATDHVVGGAVAAVGDGADPAATVRAVALGLHDVIDAHPWVGTQLTREPWSGALLPVLERFGTALQAYGLAPRELFDTVTALQGVVTGLAGQQAAVARLVPPGTDRREFLTAMAGRWSALDPARYPFVRAMAGDLPEHDDRQQFLAGIDLLLAGVAATHGGG